MCTSVDIFYPTGIVRLRHTQTISGATPVNFELSNFPTSAYAIDNMPVTVNVEIYSGYRLYAYRNVTIPARTVQVCNHFVFDFLGASSQQAGDSEVEYRFNFELRHFVPIHGVVSIELPTLFPNLVDTNVSCTIIGLEFTNAYCLIKTPNKADIYLNGSEIAQNTPYQLILSNVQNPSEDISTLSFKIASFYDEYLY